MRIFLWIGLPVLAAIGVVVGATDLLPAWQAHSGTGTTGTFTALREECSRRSCSFYGTWVATDGSRRLPDVELYDEPDTLTLGQTTEALDSGARDGVFATVGGYTYLLFSGLVLAGIAAAVGWVYVIRNAFRRRRDRVAAPVAA